MQAPMMRSTIVILALCVCLAAAQSASSSASGSSSSGSGSSSGSSSASSSGSSSGTTPTGAPTKAPTAAVTTTKIVQKVTLGIAKAAWTGDMKTTGEAGYGYTLGIWKSTTGAYVTGNSVSSAAADSRRSASCVVTFTAVVTPALAANAETQAKAMASNTTLLTAGFTAAKTKLGTSITIPTVTSIAAPTVTKPPTSAPTAAPGNATNKTTSGVTSAHASTCSFGMFTLFALAVASYQ